MPIKDKEERTVYARRWVSARRKAFFADKECQTCGSTDDLQIHHRDPATKESHCVWSWSAARREAELAKCDILCLGCHVIRHIQMRAESAGVYPGVWCRHNDKHLKKWESAIGHAGEYVRLGRFATQEEAIAAYEQASLKMRGYVPMQM